MTRRPRILFCCPVPPDPRLGAAKVYLEVAAGLGRLGWETTLAGPDEWATGAGGRADSLRAYLRTRAAGFDVVEYEHTDLPFPRSDFPPGPLFVARVILLAHHGLTAAVPPRPGLRRVVGRLVYGRARRRALAWEVAAATRTCREADAVSVANRDDRAVLVAHGVAPDRVVVLPYALSAARRAALGAADLAPPAVPRVAFVGMFDPRKGMRDFPRIVAGVAHAVPGVRFRLVGTAGMLPTAAEVSAEFPRRLRPLVEVVPRFAPDALPGLLADCSAGVFPSAFEAFGFGVLEMLAAGLPVVAYRVPGPPEMLPDEYLVRRGDAAGLAAAVAALLTDPGRLRAARAWARARAGDFDWDDIARRTAAEYARRAATGPAAAGGVS